MMTLFQNLHQEYFRQEEYLRPEEEEEGFISSLVSSRGAQAEVGGSVMRRKEEQKTVTQGSDRVTTGANNQVGGAAGNVGWLKTASDSMCYRTWSLEVLGCLGRGGELGKE